MLLFFCLVAGEEEVLEETDLYEQPAEVAESEETTTSSSSGTETPFETAAPAIAPSHTASSSLSEILNRFSKPPKRSNGIRGISASLSRISVSLSRLRAASSSLVEKISTQRLHIANLVKQWAKLRAEFVSPNTRLDRKRQADLLKQLDNVNKMRSAGNLRLQKFLKERERTRLKTSMKRTTRKITTQARTRVPWRNRARRRRYRRRGPRVPREEQ